MEKITENHTIFVYNKGFLEYLYYNFKQKKLDGHKLFNDLIDDFLKKYYNDYSNPNYTSDYEELIIKLHDIMSPEKVNLNKDLKLMALSFARTEYYIQTEQAKYFDKEEARCRLHNKLKDMKNKRKLK